MCLLNPFYRNQNVNWFFLWEYLYHITYNVVQNRDILSIIFQLTNTYYWSNSYIQQHFHTSLVTLYIHDARIFFKFACCIYYRVCIEKNYPYWGVMKASLVCRILDIFSNIFLKRQTLSNWNRCHGGLIASFPLKHVLIFDY